MPSVLYGTLPFAPLSAIETDEGFSSDEILVRNLEDRLEVIAANRRMVALLPKSHGARPALLKVDDSLSGFDVVGPSLALRVERKFSGTRVHIIEWRKGSVWDIYRGKLERVGCTQYYCLFVIRTSRGRIAVLDSFTGKRLVEHVGGKLRGTLTGPCSAALVNSDYTLVTSCDGQLLRVPSSSAELRPLGSLEEGVVVFLAENGILYTFSEEVGILVPKHRCNSLNVTVSEHGRVGVACGAEDIIGRDGFPRYTYVILKLAKTLPEIHEVTTLLPYALLILSRGLVLADLRKWQDMVMYETAAGKTYVFLAGSQGAHLLGELAMWLQRSFAEKMYRDPGSGLGVNVYGVYLYKVAGGELCTKDFCAEEVLEVAAMLDGARPQRVVKVHLPCSQMDVDVCVSQAISAIGESLERTTKPRIISYSLSSRIAGVSPRGLNGIDVTVEVESNFITDSVEVLPDCSLSQCSAHVLSKRPGKATIALHFNNALEDGGSLPPEVSFILRDRGLGVLLKHSVELANRLPTAVSAESSGVKLNLFAPFPGRAMVIELASLKSVGGRAVLVHDGFALELVMGPQITVRVPRQGLRFLDSDLKPSKIESVFSSSGGAAMRVTLLQGRICTESTQGCVIICSDRAGRAVNSCVDLADALSSEGCYVACSAPGFLGMSKLPPSMAVELAIKSAVASARTLGSIIPA
ncbi:MAG: hypothetical protein ABWW70_02140 [Thermoproteota archaeon]